MFVRVTWSEGSPDRLQLPPDGVQGVVQELKSQPGWVATVTLADRQTGSVVSVGYWESAEALRDSEPGHEARVQRGGQARGSRLRDLERYEIALLERAVPPQANTFVRLVDLRGTPAKLDETTAFVREQVVPLLKRQKGFRALLMGVNRETGRSLVGSVWDSAADREASDATLTELRRQGAQIAGAEPKVELYEVVALFEVSEGALAGSR